GAWGQTPVWPVGHQLSGVGWDTSPEVVGLLRESGRKRCEAFPQSRLVGQTKQSHLTWCIGSHQSRQNLRFKARTLDLANDRRRGNSGVLSGSASFAASFKI